MKTAAWLVTRTKGVLDGRRCVYEEERDARADWETYEDALLEDLVTRSEAEAALADAVRKEPEAKYLLVAMDDDGFGIPYYCMDEEAVKAALSPLLFFVMPGESLSDEHKHELDTHTANCLEQGGLSFEGDPPIALFKIRARGTP